jgi:hypothetical protein
LALGEDLFPVNHFPGRSSPSVALGEGFPECFGLFPECFRHSGKRVTTVVLRPAQPAGKGIAFEEGKDSEGSKQNEINHTLSLIEIGLHI